MIPATPPSLLDRLRHNQDEEAWRPFDTLYRPLLQRWLAQARIQPSDADDLIQDILRAVLQEMSQFVYDPARGRFSTWLRQFLANRLKDYYKRRGRLLPVAENERLQQTIDNLEATSEELSQRWDQEHDQHVLNQLLERVRPDFSPRTWQAFLRVLNGEAPAEVARDLGMTEPAIYSGRARILKRLREEAKGLVD
jgi:RNA polymerase sigma-70 factor (ECF subfamily)